MAGYRDGTEGRNPHINLLWICGIDSNLALGRETTAVLEGERVRWLCLGAAAILAAASGAAQAMNADTLSLEGRDNRGLPRQLFADKIAIMTEAEFLKEAEQRIWLSAYANNNLRSDYHWQADACYAEAQRRGKPELYHKAWERASRQ